MLVIIGIILSTFVFIKGFEIAEKFILGCL